MLQKLFRIALARDEKSMADFARELGVSRQYLSDVLKKRRRNDKVESQILEYTQYGLRQLHIKLDSLKSANGDVYIS